MRKILSIGTILLVVGFAVYFFFFRTAEREIIIDQFGNAVEAQVVGQDLIDLMAELRSVELNAEIFRDQAFINLTDFAITLPEEPRGRANPFESFSGRR